MIEAAIGIGASVLAALDSLANLAISALTTRGQVTAQQLLDALREQYFYDNRTLSILNRTIDGEDLSADDADRAHLGFTRNRDRIEIALANIETASLKPHRALPVEAYNKLRGLRQGKSDVRLMIDSFLQELVIPAENASTKVARIQQAKKSARRS